MGNLTQHFAAPGKTHITLDKSTVGTANFSQHLAGGEVNDLVGFEALVGFAPAQYGNVDHGGFSQVRAGGKKFSASWHLAHARAAWEVYYTLPVQHIAVHRRNDQGGANQEESPVLLGPEALVFVASGRGQRTAIRPILVVATHGKQEHNSPESTERGHPVGDARPNGATQSRPN